MTNPVRSIADGAMVLDDVGGDRMIELQRFAELGRLSATLLHEISNPLTAAILHLEQHHDQNSLNIRQARRNIQILQRYVEAARQQVRQESQPVNFYVRPQLSQIRRILTPLARRSGVRLRFDLPANYQLFGDPVKFQQIVANLVINGIDSYGPTTPPLKRKEVFIALSSRQNWVIVRVSDRGDGIDPERMTRLFEPFYTTKGQIGHGLGIGLTIVKQYVENDFHGSISVSSSPNRGTQFTAKLRITPRYRRMIFRS